MTDKSQTTVLSPPIDIQEIARERFCAAQRTRHALGQMNVSDQSHLAYQCAKADEVEATDDLFLVNLVIKQMLEAQDAVDRERIRFKA